MRPLTTATVAHGVTGAMLLLKRRKERQATVGSSGPAQARADGEALSDPRDLKRHDVQDDQVGTLVAGGVQGAGPVGLLDDGESVGLQIAAHDVADLGFVVDDEDGGLMHRSAIPFSAGRAGQG